jgi:Fe-S cluster assembly ATP-binding protein
MRFKGDDLNALPADERSVRGLFLGFQYPEEIPGVTVLSFLRRAIGARKDFDISVLEVRLDLMEWMERLGIEARFADRYLNEGFSGGEKKRSEILQMALLEPDLAVLDEPDSGLDIDALRTVAEGIEVVRAERPAMGLLLITHYQRVLRYLTPDAVHVMVGGRIVASGGLELAERLEAEGYEAFRTLEVAP